MLVIGWACRPCSSPWRSTWRAALDYATGALHLDRASERPLVLGGVLHFEPPPPSGQRVGGWNERARPDRACPASLDTQSWDDLTHRYPDCETRLDVPLPIDADGARRRFVIVVSIKDPMPVLRVQSIIDITCAGAADLRIRYKVPEKVLFPIEVAR